MALLIHSERSPEYGCPSKPPSVGTKRAGSYRNWCALAGDVRPENGREQSFTTVMQPTACCSPNVTRASVAGRDGKQSKSAHGALVIATTKPAYRLADHTVRARCSPMTFRRKSSDSPPASGLSAAIFLRGGILTRGFNTTPQSLRSAFTGSADPGSAISDRWAPSVCFRFNPRFETDGKVHRPRSSYRKQYYE
jgi:hypothetical protein